MKKTTLTTVILIALVCNGLYSQKNKINSIFKFIAKTPWIVNIGSNVIDDNGSGIKVMRNINASDYSIAKFPSEMAIEKMLLCGFRVQLTGSYNLYKAGTIINGGENAKDKVFYSSDLIIKYSLNDLIKMNKHLDPYVLAGYGYTKRGVLENVNNNFGVGTNVWVYNDFGLNLQAVGKWTMKDGATNYAQFTAGIIYKIGNGSYFQEKEEHKSAKRHIRRTVTKI